MNGEAAQLISRLGLVPLAREGGFFAPIWTSTAKVAGGRAAASTILFLVTEGDFSALHRLAMEEIWHFHAGDPVELTLLGPTPGSGRTLVIGPGVTGSHVPFAVVPAGTWQGARIRPAIHETSRGWSLCGCTVSPAWDEREFELGDRQALAREFPAHAAVVAELTR